MNKNNEIDKIAFVVLHYIEKRTTIDCVNSIKACEVGIQYSIVIVDNASPNKSGEELILYYKNENDVHVILADSNLGFAKGNNLGYIYAKNQCNANYIIIVNNDVIFNEMWKFNNIKMIYKREGAYIIGPDIFSKDGTHQSPLRQNPITDLKKVKKKIRNRKIYILYFTLKSKFPFLERIMLLEKILEKEDQRHVNKKEWQNEKEGAVLHGACLIFTPLFVEKENEAFDSRTFMYGEEDMLSQKARQKGYKMIYTPEIKILHLEEKATNQEYTGVEKKIFQHSNMLKGYKLLLEELKIK